MHAHQRLITLLKSWGVHYVFDTSFSRDFTLLETQAEFVAKYRQAAGAASKPGGASMTMLTSACPGWICYAEKTRTVF